MSDTFADASVRRNPPLPGKRHLHYLQKPGWVVRIRKSVLCGTLRCQLVTIRGRLEGDIQ